MMKYSPSRFYKEFPKEKRKKDTIVCRFLVRPISFLFSSLFACLGIGANAVSFISLLCGLASCILLVLDFFFDIKILVLISIILFFVWAILDCVDGNLARTVKKEKYGDFFDAIAGYIYPGLFFGLFGFYAAKSNDLVFGSNKQWISLLAVCASLAIITFLLSNKKFEENKAAYSEPSINNNLIKSSNKLLLAGKRIWSEISFGGFMPFIILFAYLFDFCGIVVAVYSSCFLLMSFAGLSYLILKAFKSNIR